MKALTRAIIALIALSEIIAWSMFVMKLAHWGGPMAGAGDGASTERSSDMPSILLAVAIWLLVASPNICMAAGSLNLITGKSLRVAYVYALVVLALMTLIELLTFQRLFVYLALGNVVAGGLWAWSFRGKTADKTDAELI
jgi:hypothetical protein